MIHQEAIQAERDRLLNKQARLTACCLRSTLPEEESLITELLAANPDEALQQQILSNLLVYGYNHHNHDIPNLLIVHDMHLYWWLQLLELFHQPFQPLPQVMQVWDEWIPALSTPRPPEEQWAFYPLGLGTPELLECLEYDLSIQTQFAKPHLWGLCLYRHWELGATTQHWFPHDWCWAPAAYYRTGQRVPHQRKFVPRSGYQYLRQLPDFRPVASTIQQLFDGAQPLTLHW